MPGLCFFTQERLAISIAEEETLRGDLLPQLRGLTRVGCAEGGAHRGQGSARDAPPTPYRYLDPGAWQQRLTQTPPPKVGTSPGSQPNAGVTPAVKGLPPEWAGSQDPSQGQVRERDCLGHDDMQTTRLGHGAELC